jgi:hypothetical protein
MIRLVACLLIFLPAASVLLYVRLFGVNFPYWDDWALVPLFGKLCSGTLNIGDLWAPHNDHRQLFARIIMLLLGVITKYNTVAEMYLIWVCFLVTLVIILLAFRRGIESELKLLYFVPVAFLIFSLRQWQNFLHGFEVVVAFSITFGILALYLLHSLEHSRSKTLVFLAALGSATVASFSVAQGLLVWPAGLLQLFLLRLEKRAKGVLIGAWCLVGAGEWIVYFYGLMRPPWNPPLGYVLDNPLIGIEYFLALLGGLPFTLLSVAIVGGSLLIGLAGTSLLLVYRDRKLGEYSFWIVLLCFSLLALASITVGRAGLGANVDELGEAGRAVIANLKAHSIPLGLESALTSRYTSFSILAVVSIYAMLVKLMSEKKSYLATALLGILSGFILLSVAVTFVHGLTIGKAEEAFRQRAAFVLATHESQSDERLEKYLVDTYGRHSPIILREYVPTLERLGYSVFAEREEMGTCDADN